MNRIVLFAIIAALFLACNSDKKRNKSSLSGKIEVKKSWLRPAESGSNSTAYLSLINGTSESDSLLSISSDAFQLTEVHESYETEDGLSGMRPAKDLSIASGDSLVLEPGGLHIMLMGATKTIAETDSITISLHFKKAGEKTVKIPVQQMN